jgi:hypothetical protein
MSVSIRTCPSCNALLLDDTVQCPECHHVLDSERHTELPPPPTASADPAGLEEDDCPHCGEMVRRGLVRCWNCGTFMRKDIAKYYKKMQASPRPPILSQIEPDDAGSEHARTSTRRESRDVADDGDFEMGAVDEDFELSSGVDWRETQGQADDDFDVDVPLAPLDEPANAARNREIDDLDDDPAPAAYESAPDPDQPLPIDEAPEAAHDVSPEAAAGTHSEPASDVPHSVATGGDVLLQVALEEEAEKKRRRTIDPARRGGPAAPITGFLVYCPNGHRVEVQERHRGMTGRCPKCKESFVVPVRAWHEESLVGAPTPSTLSEVQTVPVESGSAAADAVASGSYSRWIADARYHVVDPARLKLTPGSLQRDFQAADIGFSPTGMLVAVLVKRGGLFGGNDKKKEPARLAMFAHLEEDKPINELPVAEQLSLDTDQVREIRVVQPAPAGHESRFAGVPVFGTGQIAVRLPKTEGAALRFLSFALSEFRRFAAILEDTFLVQRLGEDCGIPLVDEFTEFVCHYSDEKLRALEHVEFYQNDPAYTLKIVGRRCKECGLIVSEDSRKKEKIGPASGKGIAKALCPKCKKKFGDISLFAIDKGPGRLETDATKESEPSAELDQPGAEQEEISAP